VKRQLLCATLLAIVATGHVDAEAPSETGRSDKRVALVIGNAAYAVGRLNNPILDARAMAESLRTLGFEVLARENLTYRDMRRRWPSSASASPPAGSASSTIRATASR